MKQKSKKNLLPNKISPTLKKFLSERLRYLNKGRSNSIIGKLNYILIIVKVFWKRYGGVCIDLRLLSPLPLNTCLSNVSDFNEDKSKYH